MIHGMSGDPVGVPDGDGAGHGGLHGIIIPDIIPVIIRLGGRIIIDRQRVFARDGRPIRARAQAWEAEVLHHVRALQRHVLRLHRRDIITITIVSRVWPQQIRELAEAITVHRQIRPQGRYTMGRPVLHLRVIDRRLQQRRTVIGVRAHRITAGAVITAVAVRFAARVPGVRRAVCHQEA